MVGDMNVQCHLSDVSVPDFLFTFIFFRALSQIFALSPDAVQNAFQTEAFLTFYDIFVRNAFGNYKDVLKEVCEFVH